MIKFGCPNLPKFEDIQLDIKKILDSKQIITGKYVKELEDLAKEISGTKYAIATNSGTTAFSLLLASSKIKGTIGMPAFTWQSCKNIAKWFDYKIKWLDISKEDWLINETKNVDLLVPTNTFGNIKHLDTKIPTIYDDAHSLGLEGIGDKGMGSFISLSPMKTFTGIEGGLVLTNHKKIAEKCLDLRNSMGRMSEINALIALNNLKERKYILKAKKIIYETYKENLPFMRFQKIHRSTYNEIGGFFQTPTQRFLMEQKLKEKMEIRRRYDPLDVKLSNTSYIWDRLFMLPSYLEVNEKQVIKEVKKAWEEIGN